MPSDISDFVKKFNSGAVDSIAARRMPTNPLEINKGLGNGALFNFPVVNITGDVIIRSENSQIISVCNQDSGLYRNYQVILQPLN